MSLFGALCFVVVCVFAGELQIVGAGSDGTYYKCSELKKEDGCKQTFWCVWQRVPTGTNPDDGICFYDPCLKWIADTEGDSACPTDTATVGFDCKAYYLDEKVNCSTGDLTQSNRFCRTNAAQYQKASLASIEGTCFYEDLKATNTSTRSCGHKSCKWMNTSNGNYCMAGGSEDCTTYTEGTDAHCQCLGKDYCDLHPYCYLNGSVCNLDPCVQYQVDSNGVCSRGLILHTECVGRSEYYWDSSTTPGSVKFRTTCFTSGSAKKRNECYFAMKVTVTNSPYLTGNDTNNTCANIDYDESACTGEQVFDESLSPARPPVSDAKNCQLVPIASGYFKNTQYCTDGDRTVPSPDASSLVQVSSVVTLVLMLAALLL